MTGFIENRGGINFALYSDEKEALFIEFKNDENRRMVGISIARDLRNLIGTRSLFYCEDVTTILTRDLQDHSIFHVGNYGPRDYMISTLRNASNLTHDQATGALRQYSININEKLISANR